MKNGGAVIIKSLLRPQLTCRSLDAAYRRMAGEEAREKEAIEWAEDTLGDVADGAR
jgi:hypothetical protein